MVELESNWRVGVGNDLQRTLNHRHAGWSVPFTFPPILCMAMMAVWSESKLINPYPR